MRANGIKHETTTTGTGAVTLTAVAGWPTFASVFGSSGSRMVEYTILDASGVPIEGGVGTVTLSTLSLERTIVRWTWDGSAYTGAGATALSLAAGTKSVICAPSADSAFPSFPSVATTVTDNIGHGSLGAGTSAQTVGLVNGRTYFIPYRVMKAFAVSKATARCVNGYTGGTSQLLVALYEIGSNGFPGARLVNFGSLGSLTIGTLTSTPLGTPVYLPVGEYICGVNSTFSGGSGSPTVRALTMLGPISMGISIANAAPIAMLARDSQTTLPDPAVAPTTHLGGTTHNTIFVSLS